MKVLKYIDNYLKSYNNYKDYWNYEDGCILQGCIQLFYATGDNKYFDFILNYLNPLISADGTILNYDTKKYNIDSFNSGKVLFSVFDETNDIKYRYAQDFLMEKLKHYPRTEEGNFIHKSIYPGQVWLDGLYMAQPFYAEYDKRYNNFKNFEDIMTQFRNVRNHMYISEKSLYVHAYDSLKIQPWANDENGLSKNCWLRAMGWYLMALADLMDIIAQDTIKCKEIELLLLEALDGIIKYRDRDTGLFYQVIDYLDNSKNYTETSGSLMVSYALMKVKKFEYFSLGAEIFDSVIKNKLIQKEKNIYLSDICSAAGLGPGNKRDGSIEYYLSEKIVSDDPKGAGALMMAYSKRMSIEEKL